MDAEQAREYAIRDKLAEAHELIAKWQAAITPGGPQSILLNIKSLRRLCAKLEKELAAPIPTAQVEEET